MKLSVSFIDNGRVSRHILTELFEEYGQVESVKMFRGMSQSHGRVLAFVEMKYETQAIVARDSLNKTEFEGTQLIVSFSNDRINKLNTGALAIPAIEDDDDDDDDDMGGDDYDTNSSYDDDDEEEEEEEQEENDYETESWV